MMGRGIASVVFSCFRRGCIALPFLLLVVAPALSDPAIDDAAATKGQRVADTVMSPFCPGRTLSACPSDDARQLRTEVSGWFAEGATDDQVRSRLTERYGREVLGTPESEGLGLFAWLMPVAFIVIGIAVIGRVLRAG